ncbi:MAG: thiol:disulfide interchange protein DsbA/DsbL [Gammaproteobacteria bacterium]|nr:thiol:disulfide interchange protein DsbA/DsbL [Gammaproteobacteria bacterium]
MIGRWGVGILFLLMVCAPVHADDGSHGIRGGTNYKAITTPQPTSAPAGKVEVIEFLWYDCQTCYVMQPLVERWLAENRERVAYSRVPAVTGDNMIYFARVFYTANALGVLDTATPALFAAIHRYARPLDNDEKQVEFFGELGVERARFLSVFRNSGTMARVREAQVMNRRYDVQGAPTLVIDGRYRIDPTMVASPEAMIEELDFLVKQALEKRAKD